MRRGCARCQGGLARTDLDQWREPDPEVAPCQGPLFCRRGSRRSAAGLGRSPTCPPTKQARQIAYAPQVGSRCLLSVAWSRREALPLL